MLSHRLFLPLLLLASSNSYASEQLTVAVASNFQSTATEIAALFSKSTQIPVRISSGSTGSLYARIINGAPYDVFLAADTERPLLLAANGVAETDSTIVYAIGTLVLWSADPRFDNRNCLQDFANGDFSRLAIANPATAPYGRAAKAYLQEAKLWDKVSDKLVFGENVAQTYQFVATGNATLGLVAASQLAGRKVPIPTCFERISEEQTGGSPIHQAGVVLTASQNKSAARQFMRFVQSPEMIELLGRRGYGVPAVPLSEH
jgi:molybdate transport system substrate-binding protein